jgi:hypothetical protein
MPYNFNGDELKNKFAQETPLTLDNFKRGVITLIDQSKLSRNALKEFDNGYLTEDGAPTIRPGIDWFGTAIASTVRTGSPTTYTNLCLNPSFETNTTNWSSYQGATISRVTTEHYNATASLKVVHPGTGSANQGAQTDMITVSPSTTHYASCYVKGTAGVYIVLQIDAYTSGGVYQASSSAVVLLDGSWQRISVSRALAATEAKIVVAAYASLGTTFYADAFLIEQSTTLADYYDGTTTSTADTDYAWTGTTNNSTSTKSVYAMTTATIDGFDYFDFDGVIHLVAAVNGSIYRSTDDGRTWTICTGGTYTAGTDVCLNQYNSGLYITTGASADNILIYNGTTTLTGYTSLATPAAPTVVKTGLAATTYTYYYKIAAVNTVGYSIASLATSVQVSLPRSSWDSTSNYVTVTTPAPVATQTRFDIYFSEDNINYYYIDSIVSSTAVPSVTYKDSGTAPVIPSTIAPTTNTTQGPKVAELKNVGSRMYGVRDYNNRYRIWFTTGSPPYGAFSNGYDGGYLDWSPGGKFIPMHVEDYRDRSGAPVATIWCNSADGEGCILQMFLEDVTVGNNTVTVPSAYKLAGSRGTNAPGSVVNVLNDYMYYNSQAFYNLGTRAQFLNLLSTDESSANIRPTVRQINGPASSKIASAFYDAKVFFSVAYGSATSNSHTIVYDTEQKAWLPTAFTVGFKKFLRYTDTAGVRRLLAIKPGDNRLSEISVDILGDYGAAFETSLTTGLYSVTKNRFEFQTTSKGYIEFSNPQGEIIVDVLGIDRKNGYRTVKTVSLTAESSTTDTGWDTFSEDGSVWDDTSETATTYSESSVKRYFIINKELNAVQWHLSTNSANARYVLRTLQTEGTDTQSGPPRQWRITG